MKRLIVFLFLFFSCLSFAASWYAEGPGNASEVTWDSQSDGGGSHLTWASLGATDILYTNSHNITIDTSFTCGSIRSSVVTGGSFLLSSGTVTVNADVVGGLKEGLKVSGGTLTHVGSITGGGSATASGMEISAGSVSHTGTTTAGTNATAYGIEIAGNSVTLVHIGNISGSANSIGLYTGAVTGLSATITGNITGGSGGDGLSFNGAGTITIRGNVTGGSGNSIIGVRNTSTGTIYIYGTITGGTVHPMAYGVFEYGNGTTYVTGSLIFSTYAATVNGLVIYQPGAADYVQFTNSGATAAKLFLWDSSRGYRSRYKYEP